MNALELYEAVFDQANDGRDSVTADNVMAYAEGAFDLYISQQNAEKIADLRAQWLVMVDDGTATSNEHFHLVEKVLAEIEL